MGCCGSKDNSHEPNESTHLLAANQTNSEDLPGQPTMDAQLYEAEALERETETLNQIVQKTAENLIDISRIHSVERVKQHEANMRSEEYQHILQESERLGLLDENTKRLSQIFNLPNYPEDSTANGTDVKDDRVEQLLGLGSSPDSRRKMESFQNLSKQIGTKLDDIHIQNDKEFIVPLTFGSNTPSITNP